MQCILCCLRDEMSSHPATSCNFRVVLRDVTLKNITIVELKRRGTRDCMAYFPKCLQRNISVNYFHITRKSFQGSSHVGLVWNSAADSPFGTLSNQVQPSFCRVVGWRGWQKPHITDKLAYHHQFHRNTTEPLLILSWKQQNRSVYLRSKLLVHVVANIS